MTVLMLLTVISGCGVMVTSVLLVLVLRCVSGRHRVLEFVVLR